MIKRKLVLSVFLFSLLAVNAFAATSNWVIGAEKFSYSRGQTQNSITEATAESLPVELLEKLGNALVRVILPDEALERTRYDLRKERLSLFLQLSSEYRKRDAIFLNDYDEKELKKKLEEEKESIDKIQEKIEDNLQSLKEAEEQAEKKSKKLEEQGYDFDTENQGELKKFSNLFNNLISRDEDLYTSEDIAFYQNDSTKLFTPSEKAKTAGYDSYAFESEMMSAKINTLLTGVITNYGQYMSLTVTAYSYPGGKVIGSATELGSLQEKDLLINSLARQLVPILTNAMPVVVNFDINPKENFHLYIDDIIQNVIPENMIIDSGVHNLQITCDGYESAGTSYFFQGNERYKIEVNLKTKEDGLIKIGMIKPLGGDIYTNGLAAKKLDENKSMVKINGQSILGEFISEDGKTDFFFIPENLLKNNTNVLIKPKPQDRSDYIEKRRKWMYRSYSLLITSLVPFFYTYGNYYNVSTLANEGFGTYDDDATSIQRGLKAQNWEKAFNICKYVTIGCGSAFIVEMLRYFKAADSVLPQKAKKAGAGQQELFDYVAPPVEVTPADENEITESNYELNETEAETESETLSQQEQNNVEN